MQNSAAIRFILAVIWGLTVVAIARAGTPPSIDFDIPVVTSCRDVTPPDFSAKYPDRKFVEVKVEISSDLSNGKESDLENLNFDICLGEPVRDFLPKTRLETDVIGPMSIVETSKSGIGGDVSCSYGLASGQLSAGKSTTSQVTLSKLPPKDVVVDAGVADGGVSASFDLKPSSQRTLLGQSEYCLIIEVPSDWRGGFGYVTMTAKGINRGHLWDSSVLSGFGSRLFLVYLDRETELKRMAEGMAERLTSLNANCTIPANVDFSTYRSEDDIARSYISSTTVKGLADYYYASQNGLDAVRNEDQIESWNSEISQLDTEIGDAGAFKSRGIRSAFKIFRTADRIQSLYNKCFRPSLFDAEEYSNDCKKEVEVLNSLPE